MRKLFPAAAVLLMILLLSFSVVACKSNNTTTNTTTAAVTTGGATTIADSIVTAQIINIAAQSTGYPWTLVLVIESASNVGTLLNPVADSIGGMVTVVTDQDMSTFNVNDTITANITIAANANGSLGINLYMYNAALQSSP
ncbi:MAG: hypothetical protein ACLPVI_00275 [Dehalococcoidales bacterium]